MSKFNRVVSIGGETVKADSVAYNLELSAVGTARLSLLTSETLSGLVVIKSGHSGKPLVVDFVGVIQDQLQKDSRRRVVLCRELTAVLNLPLFLTLRHCTASDVLKALSDKTGLAFSLPDKPYAKKKAACFYTASTGLHAIKQLGIVFNIPDFIWYQGEKGEVFVGSYSDSGRIVDSLNIKESLFYEVKTTEAKAMPLPGFKPGNILNGRIVHSVNVDNSIVGLEWSKTLSDY